MVNPTCVKQAKDLALQAIQTKPDEWFSAGQITKVCNLIFKRNLPRTAYKRALDELTLEGSVASRMQSFWRNGHSVKGSAYRDRPSVQKEVDAGKNPYDPFDGKEDREERF